MKKNYTLRIKTPCDQPWGQMLPNKEGRFCLHCEKTVVDFTMMRDEEIALYLHRHQGEKFCSRMTTQQRNRSYTYIQPEITHSPVKRYVLALLAGLMVVPSMAVAQVTQEETFIEYVQEMQQSNGQVETSISLPPHAPNCLVIQFQLTEEAQPFAKEIYSQVKIRLDLQEMVETQRAIVVEVEERIRTQEGLLAAKLRQLENTPETPIEKLEKKRVKIQEIKEDLLKLEETLDNERISLEYCRILAKEWAAAKQEFIFAESDGNGTFLLNLPDNLAPYKKNANPYRLPLKFSLPQLFLKDEQNHILRELSCKLNYSTDTNRMIDYYGPVQQFKMWVTVSEIAEIDAISGDSEAEYEVEE